MNTIRSFPKFGMLFGLLAMIVITGILAIKLPSLQYIRNYLHPILQSARNSFHPILDAVVKAEPPQLGEAPIITPKHIVWEMLGKVNKDRAMNDLRKLTGDEEICIDAKCYTIANRQTGSEGLHWAKQYIYEELVHLGYSVRIQDWSSSGYADQNIIAEKAGKLFPFEKIFFVAHIDGVQASGKASAADDNASGVVDLLELARVLSNYSFQRSLVLFFSTGEEQGKYGVKSYLDRLSTDDLSSIQYAVDVDMVGYDANQDRKMELWYGGDPDSLGLTQIMSETIHTYKINLMPEYIIGCG